MKKLILVMLLLPLLGSAQYECHPEVFTFVGGADLGYTHGHVINGAKIGFWQNNQPSGYTFTIGLTNALFYNRKFPKLAPDEKVTFYGEAGYKLRVANHFLLHGFIGTNKRDGYIGGAVFYKLDKHILVGAGYKQKAFGINILISNLELYTLSKKPWSYNF